MRRELADTLQDVLCLAAPDPALAVHVTELALDLPVELALRYDPDGAVLLGDLPASRLRTSFDVPPGRIRLRCREVAS
jgi:hypothetical protein